MEKDDFIIVLVNKKEKEIIQENAQKNNESLTRFCLNKILQNLKGD